MINVLIEDDSLFDEKLYTTPTERSTVHLLQMHLTAFVPFLVEQFLSGQKELVMPRPDLSSYLAENGNALIYRSQGRTRKAMAALTEAIATSAFCPGGIRAFGLRFEVPLDVIERFLPEFFELRTQQTNERGQPTPLDKNDVGVTLPAIAAQNATFEQLFRQPIMNMKQE